MTCTQELALISKADVEVLFQHEKPEHAFRIVKKIGTIIANHIALADFMHDNMIPEMNVIQSA